MELIRQKNQDSELDDCTFKPKLIAAQVQAGHPATRKGKEMPSWERKEDADLKACTFQPDTSKPLLKSSVPQVQGF